MLQKPNVKIQTFKLRIWPWQGPSIRKKDDFIFGLFWYASQQ
jgi:hypothetical protein